MKNLTVCAIALLNLTASTAISLAGETYCQGDYLRVFDGGTFVSNHTAVIGSARKTQLPGQEKPTTGCSYNWNSLGGFYKPIEITKQPKLGTISIPYKYRIFYKPTRVGDDEFVAKIQWVGPTGQLSNAIVTYKIKNVDRPI